MYRKLMIGLAIAGALSACKPNEPATSTAAAAPDTNTAANPTTPVSTHNFSPEINAADFVEMVKTLSSDEFEGRAPGSAGEEKTVEYIKAQMQRIGLQPGSGDSYFQVVPITETTANPATILKLENNGKTTELKFGTDMVVGTRTGQTEVKLDASEMIFVGYGVDAPERQWNDYAGQDWTGKTVVMLVNDPGFHTKDAKLFDGDTMTYYGRWIYKFEEASRKGAAAALIIHDTPGASYGWDVVKNSWSGPQFDLPAKTDSAPRVPIQGWLTGDAARQLFTNAGLNLDDMYKAASKPGFKPVPLNTRATVNLASTVSEKTSRNVIGVLPGTSNADEAVVYMAHWDHLGKHDDEPGDNIYNGALDNATGVSGILEIAEAFAKQETKPERSVVFAAVTLEESGLLGSKYYVANPTYPLNKIAGVINIDSMSIMGKAKDMTIVGKGNSELEDILANVAKAQGRRIEGESNPAAGSYFRSDHFNFAKAGVPALYAGGGRDLVEGGVEASKKFAEQRAKNYHAPSDQYDESWNVDGAVQDSQALYEVGKEISAGNKWPQWYKGNPFKAARDAMMKGASATAPAATEPAKAN